MQRYEAVEGVRIIDLRERRCRGPEAGGYLKCLERVRGALEGVRGEVRVVDAWLSMFFD